MTSEMDFDDLEKRMSDISVISENENTYNSIIKWNIPQSDFMKIGEKKEISSKWFLIGTPSYTNFFLKLSYIDAFNVRMCVIFCSKVPDCAWLEGKIVLHNGESQPFSISGKEGGKQIDVDVSCSQRFLKKFADTEEDPVIKCFMKIKLREIKCTVDKYTIQRIESRNYDSNKYKCSVNDFLSDVTIMVEDWKIQAHKMLLAKIPFFNQLFKEDQSKKCFHLIDVDKALIENVINYLYTEEVPELNFRLACELFVVANDLQMCDLKSICSSYLGANLTQENVFIVFTLSVEEDDIYLKKLCIKFIRSSNFEHLAKESLVF